MPFRLTGTQALSPVADSAEETVSLKVFSPFSGRPLIPCSRRLKTSLPKKADLKSLSDQLSALPARPPVINEFDRARAWVLATETAIRESHVAA
jgi:hypothetical protein